MEFNVESLWVTVFGKWVKQKIAESSEECLSPVSERVEKTESKGRGVMGKVKSAKE